MQKMSFPQLGGYSLASVGGPPSALPAAAAAPPPSSQLLMASSSTSTSPTSSAATSGGRPAGMLGEAPPPPASGQTLLDYPAGLLAAAYPRMAAAGLTSAEATAGVYGSYAAAAAAQSYLPTALSTDPSSVLYGSLANSPYDLKDSAEAWRNLQAQTAAYYSSYDPMMAYPGYNGFGFDFNAARRKNATKENTGTLKAWLGEHRKNPYPTKGEKIMLAIITKMTLTQVSTWFANARRRLKKENKMTWTPKNGSRDSDDDDDDDGDDKRDDVGDNNNSLNKSGDSRDLDVEIDVESTGHPTGHSTGHPTTTTTSRSNKHEEDLLSDGEEEIDAGSVSDTDPSNERHHSNVSSTLQSDRHRLTSPPSSSGSPPPCAPIPFRPPGAPVGSFSIHHPHHHPGTLPSRSTPPSSNTTPSTTSSSDASVKPRIWSLADVVASSNPHSRLSPPGNTALPHSAFGTPAGLRPQSHPHHGVGPIPGSPLRPWVHQGSSPYGLHGTSATQTLAGFAPHPYGLAAARAAAVAAGGHLPPPGTSCTSSPGSPAVPSFSRLPVNVPSPVMAHHRDGQRILNGLSSLPQVNEKSAGSNPTSSPGNPHGSRTAFTPVVKRNLNEPLKV